MLDHKDSPYIRAVRQGGARCTGTMHVPPGCLARLPSHHWLLRAPRSHATPRSLLVCLTCTHPTPYRAGGLPVPALCVRPPQVVELVPQVPARHRGGGAESRVRCVLREFLPLLHARALPYVASLPPRPLPRCLPQEFDPSPQGQGCMVTMGDFVRDVMLDQVGPECCRLVCFMLPRWPGCCTPTPHAYGWQLQAPRRTVRMFISAHGLCAANCQGQLLATRDAMHAHDAMLWQDYLACCERCFPYDSVAAAVMPTIAN